MYLVLSNISKRPNIRSLLLTAAALGCSGVFVVGQAAFDTNVDGGDLPGQIIDHVNQGKMFIKRFCKWHECTSYLQQHGIRLVGIEIHKQAINIEAFVAQEPNQDVAFLPGNEGQGLNEKQMKSCDAFCIISQYGGGTASLNVNVATSIILHRFYEYQQRRMQRRLECDIFG
jgi:tRNA G18 (ribose-2'-O)-methylase SpoU